MSIKVIGAGFPRTGTTTVKGALEILGFKGTYHFKDLIAGPERLKYWLELENTGATDFEALFDGYMATSDFPGYSYYKILADKYPEAKIILTTRDFDSWYESNLKTINKVDVDNDCIQYMRNTYIIKAFNGQFETREIAEKMFHAHNEEVKRVIPEDRLLVYSVTDGWEKLCGFLGVDIPDMDFPHLNKKEQFPMMLEKMLGQK